MHKIEARYSAGKYISAVPCSIDKVIENVHIILSKEKDELFLMVSGDDEKIVQKNFANAENLIFLCFGAFPEMKEYFIDEVAQDVSKRNIKFKSRDYYRNTDMVFHKIDEDCLSVGTFGVLNDPKKINMWIIWTLEALVSLAYEHILSDHRTVLLMQAMDGLIPNRSDAEKRADESAAKQLYFREISQSQNTLGKYFTAMNRIMQSTLFYYEKQYNSEILNTLGITEYQFLHTIADTRNWYSHYLKVDQKVDRIKQGKAFVSYFEILYASARVYILRELGLHEDENRVKEFFFSVHDWINALQDGNAPLKNSWNRFWADLKKMMDEQKQTTS